MRSDDRSSSHPTAWLIPLRLFLLQSDERLQRTWERPRQQHGLLERDEAILGGRWIGRRSER